MITAKSKNGIAFTNLLGGQAAQPGQSVTFTSSPKNSNAEFLGWFNEKGEKVSGSPCFTAKITNENACFTAQYTAGTTPADVGTPAEITKALQENARYEPLFEKAVINKGDPALLAKVLKKAQAGQSLTVVGLGGSITMGAGTSWTDHSGRYLNKVCTALEKMLGVEVKVVNAGIGATTSLLAKGRLQEHVLRHRPDLVLLDFTTNDQGGEVRYAYSYEAVVRTLAEAQIATVAILFGNIRNDLYQQNGTCVKNGYARHLHLPVLQYYNIPTIDYYGALWDYLDSNGDGVSNEKDLAQWTALWDDYIHPNTAGHALAASTIVAYIKTVQSNLQAVQTVPPAVPSTLLFNETQHYLTAEMYSKNNIGAKLTAFENVEYGFYGNKDANTIYNWHPWLINCGGYLEFTLPSLKGVTLMHIQGPAKILRINGREDAECTLSKNSAVTVTVNSKPVLKDSTQPCGAALNWASETYTCREEGSVQLRITCTEGTYCLTTVLLAE